jgi:ACS family D-galactonate transporter-like MFS transporter
MLPPMLGRPSTSRRAATIALVVLCQSAQALAFGGIALFLPLIQSEVGMSFAQAGALAASSSLVYALMQIPAGLLADRFRVRTIFAIGVVGSNAMAFSFAQLQQFWQLVANQAVTGFFRSLVFAPGLMVISGLFPPQRRATAMGLFVAGGFSSSILLSTVGPALVEVTGWRALFMAFSLLGLVLLVLYLKFGINVEGRGRTAVGAREMLATLGNRLMLLVLIVQFVRLAVVQGVGFWLPTFLVLDRGLPLPAAGLIVALGAALTAPSNFVGGYVSDRLGSPVRVIGTSLGVLAVTTYLVPRVDNLALLVVVIAVNAVFIQVYFGPLFALPIALFGDRTAGVSSGVSNFAANIGGLTSAYAMGVLRDRTQSFTAGFTTLSVLCVLGLLTVFALERVARGRAQARA